MRAKSQKNKMRTGDKKNRQHDIIIIIIIMWWTLSQHSRSWPCTHEYECKVKICYFIGSSHMLSRCKAFVSTKMYTVIEHAQFFPFNASWKSPIGVDLHLKVLKTPFHSRALVLTLLWAGVLWQMAFDDICDAKRAQLQEHVDCVQIALALACRPSV